MNEPIMNSTESPNIICRLVPLTEWDIIQRRLHNEKEQQKAYEEIVEDVVKLMERVAELEEAVNRALTALYTREGLEVKDILETAIPPKRKGENDNTSCSCGFPHGSEDPHD